MTDSTDYTDFTDYFDPDVLGAARDLCADSASNSEYVRGVAELLIDTQVPQRPDVHNRLSMDWKEELIEYLGAPRTSHTIYRTAYTVEVFSRGPFHPTRGDGDPFDLETINYAITEGDCIGDVRVETVDIVPSAKVVEELVRIGNDGTFFDELDA